MPSRRPLLVVVPAWPSRPPPTGLGDVVQLPLVHGRPAPSALLRRLAFCVVVAVRARRYARVLLVTTGSEIALTGLLRPLFRGTRLDAVDPILRAEPPSRLTRHGFAAVDRFFVIRRGDTATLGRGYGVPPDRCSFLPFPSVAVEAADATGAGPDVYSAGSAHRDWVTLARALELLPGVTAVLSGCPEALVQHLGTRVTVLPLLSPEEGQAYVRTARLVVVPLQETVASSGPLVVLDALAAGTPVVATAVNGTRDYVEHDVTGLLVPVADPSALAVSVGGLLGDATARRRLAAAGREWSLRNSEEAFWTALAEVSPTSTEAARTP